MTISGGHLPEHEGGFENVMSGDDWDVVVMQGHSLGPISDDTAEPFREAARKFARIAHKQGTRPVFFMTWAYTGKPEMTAQLDKAYTDIGKELDAEVVPVGLSFARVTTERPDIALRYRTTHGIRRWPAPISPRARFFAALYDAIAGRPGLRCRARRSTQPPTCSKVAWQTVQDYANARIGVDVFRLAGAGRTGA